MYVHNFSTCETKTWKKNSGLKGILTYDFCDAGPVLPELSSRPTGSWSWSQCEFLMHLEMMKNANEYIKYHLFELRQKIWLWFRNCLSVIVWETVPATKTCGQPI